MKGWTALVPFKPAGTRKTRLAARLSPEARDRLAEQMFAHVIGVMERAAMVERIVLVAAEPPEGWRHGWIADPGQGLNAALTAARDTLRAPRLMIIHADLPRLAVADILALAEPGCALAPDLHGTGTNALALCDFPDFRFQFGPASLAAHIAAARGSASLVERDGLAFDVDTVEDYEEASKRSLF